MIATTTFTITALIIQSIISVANAATLPSNGLNRWNKEPLSILIRGGEAAVQTVSSTSSKPRLLIDDTTSTSAPKVKKRRKKRSSSSSSSSSSTKVSPSPIKSKGTTSSPIQATTPTIQSQQQKQQQQQQQQQSATTEEASTQSTETTTKSSTTSKSTHDKMPSIFQPEESIYDKYAACLAATEGLRRIRDAKVPKKKPFRSAVNVDAERSTGWKSLLKGDSSSSSSSLSSSSGDESGLSKQEKVGMAVEQQKEEYKRACAEYVLNSSKVIKALGLSVSQFNQLGREIRKNGPLKERVSYIITRNED